MAQRALKQTISIPQDLATLLTEKLGVRSLDSWGLEAVVVEAAKEHLISRGRAASLLGLEDYESRNQFFEKHGLLNEYTMEMLDEDFKRIESRRAST